MKLLWYIGLAAPSALFAQTGRVNVQLDTTTLRIGEQVTLTISVAPNEQGHGALVWPAIGDTLSKHVEVVHDAGVDTVKQGEDVGHYVRILKLTCFDTGYWAVPAFRFQLDGAMLESEALLIHVQGVPLDSSATLYDIRDIYEVPFNLGFWLKDHWYLPLGGAALVALALLVMWAVRKRKAGMDAKPIAPREVPLHERIVNALRRLEKERLWQNGAHKEYQSRLTDLLRGYIEERYHVPALERTTDELLQELKVSPLNSDQRDLLANTLHTADMVKFAKALPSPAENEQMMAGAIQFVQATALVQSNPPTPERHAS